MEEDHILSISGNTVVIEANLRDETFWKLVADFYGSQAGLELDLETQQCKNRLLIQVGLMREDNRQTWGAVEGWLQKILPNHQSAFFQGLIEMAIATTLSLGSDARRTFLESEVNFNFVGPMCDIIGVERTALLEMRDFSEQAKSIEVTNGLILELCNFVAREKLDPVVLVTWLRNFHPLFCQDGDIQKAYKGLRPRINRLKSNYGDYTTMSYGRNTAMETLIHSPFQLVRERRKVIAKEEAVAAVVAVENSHGEETHSLHVKEEDSPVTEELEMKEQHGNDEILSVMKDEEVSFNSNKGNVGEAVPLSIDSTQAVSESDPVRKATDDGKNSLTLLDIAMINIKKVTFLRGGEAGDSKQRFKIQYSLTCEEHPDVKEFEDKITSLAKDLPLAPPFVFLHHNACFLVDVHNAVERELMRAEREMESNGTKLGRNKNPKFKSFVDFSESAASRYVHMAYDVLCSEDSALNKSKFWVEFCDEKGNPSKLSGNLSDRLDSCGYFEAAAGLIHHHEEIPHFLSDLLLLDDGECPNIVLESVNGDAADDVLQSLVYVLAVVYCKILGPYYQLLKSDADYRLFCRYILCLYQKLLEWSKNPSMALEPEQQVNVFLQEPLQERTFVRVFQHGGRWHKHQDLIGSCLKNIVNVIATAVDEHLLDFLPGGKYCHPPLEDICIQNTGCTFSALMREYPFSNPYPKLVNGQNPLSSESSSEEDDSSDVNNDESNRIASPRAKKARLLNATNGEEKAGGVTSDDADRKPHMNMDRLILCLHRVKPGDSVASAPAFGSKRKQRTVANSGRSSVKVTI